MITRHCLSCQDRSKVGQDARCAWMAQYRLSLKDKRFLVEGHRYRSKKFYNHFDGMPEFHSAPVQRDGRYVFKMVRTIQVIYGKKKEDGKKRKRDKAPIDGVPFKKQSILYTSPCRIG